MGTQTIVDTTVKDSETPRYPTRPTHRTYTRQFNAEMVAEVHAFQCVSATGTVCDLADECESSLRGVPLFKITDKRGAASDRAKREAERRTDSFEQMIERGVGFAAVDSPQDPEDVENDAASERLRNNDPSAAA